jgi:CO/xanthine dehydrogenase Mo-binding subunit
MGILHNKRFKKSGICFALIFSAAINFNSGTLVSAAALPSESTAMTDNAFLTSSLSTGDGQVIIHSPSQSPYIIRKKISRHFGVDTGKITVHTPMVGGAFGGKAAVQLEMLAYMCTTAVGGREIIIVNTREEDMITSP